MLIAVAAGAMGAAPSVIAQASWDARVIIKPAPLPAGRCGGITVELVDENGYRRNELQNGAPLDSRRFVYTVSDTTNFHWQDNTPTIGYLCTDKALGATKTTVTVALPDGNTGSVELEVVPFGTSVPAKVYAAQAPLWRPGITPATPLPGSIAAQRGTHAATSAGVVSQGGPSAQSPIIATGASATTKSATVGTTSATTGGNPGAPSTTTPGTGTSTGGGSTPPTSVSFVPMTVSVAALSLSGTASASNARNAAQSVFAPMAISVAALSLTGTGASSGRLAAIQSTFEPASVTVVALSLIGTGVRSGGDNVVFAPMTISVASLALTGTNARGAGDLSFAAINVAVSSLSLTGTQTGRDAVGGNFTAVTVSVPTLTLTGTAAPKRP